MERYQVIGWFILHSTTIKQHNEVLNSKNYKENRLKSWFDYSQCWKSLFFHYDELQSTHKRATATTLLSTSPRVVRNQFPHIRQWNWTVIEFSLTYTRRIEKDERAKNHEFPLNRVVGWTIEWNFSIFMNEKWAKRGESKMEGERFRINSFLLPTFFDESHLNLMCTSITAWNFSHHTGTPRARKSSRLGLAYL